MANKCPKCGGKLSPLYLKQNCPHCGVNLVYYNAEERLEQDAIKAEAEWAALDRWLTRLKGATIQGPLTIIRLIWAFVPLILLALLPLFRTQLTFPFVDGGVQSINGISAVMNIFSTNFTALGALGEVEALSAVPVQTYLYIGCLLLAAVFAFLLILSVAFSYTKHGELRNILFAAAALVTTVAAAVLYVRVYTSTSLIGMEIASCEIGIGVWLTVAALAVYMVLNIIMMVRRRKAGAENIETQSN